MSCAVAQRISEEKDNKANLDTVPAFEDYPFGTRIVSYWATGTKVREDCIVVQLGRVAEEDGVATQVSQYRFVLSW